MGTNLLTRQLAAVTCRAEIRALRPSATAAVGRAPRVACHGLQLHARSAIVPKTGCRDIGPRLTLKSGSVEAARFLPKARLEAEATPHVTALREGALLYLKCFSEEFSCRADRLAPIEHPSTLCPRTHIGLCHNAANELARQSRGADGAGRSRRVRCCS